MYLQPFGTTPAFDDLFIRNSKTYLPVSIMGMTELLGEEIIYPNQWAQNDVVFSWHRRCQAEQEHVHILKADEAVGRAE